MANREVFCDGSIETAQNSNRISQWTNILRTFSEVEPFHGSKAITEKQHFLLRR